MCSDISLVGCLLFVLFPIETVFGGATLSLRFVHFTNPDGLGSNGHCCDGRDIFCVGQCDHMFTTCLDHAGSRSRDANFCPHGKKQSGRILNQDSINFGSVFGGTRNPMFFHFDIWPGSMKLKVKVFDYDAVGEWDDVDYLEKILSYSPASTQFAAKGQVAVVESRTSLTIEYKVFCDQDFYGPSCATYCRPRDDASGHNTCNKQTGHKVCHAGWTGSDCDLPVDECGDSPCLNGGHCTDLHNAFSCTCPEGFTGERCEIDTDECSSNPCMNGGFCEDQANSYSCVCDEGFNGTNCEIVIPPCHFEPCLNNGTCIEINDTEFNCTCLKGFHGDDCEFADPPEYSIDDGALEPSSAPKSEESFVMSVMVTGSLDENDEMAIEKWVREKMDQTGKLPGDDLTVKIRMQECSGEESIMVTEVFIAIKYEGDEITEDDMNFAMSHINRALNRDFLYDRYTGTECGAGRLSARKTTSEDTWVSQNWLILVLLVAALVIIVMVIVGVVMFRRRRRHGKRAEPGVAYECVESASPVTTPSDSMTHTDVTEAFGNALYLYPEEAKDVARDSAFDEEEDSIYQVID